MTSFALLHDKSIPITGGEFLTAECCPAMDLIALASPTHLVIHRSIKWERLQSIPCQLSSLTWRPDGKALAVGHEDGSISLYDAEKGGEAMVLPYSARPHSSSVTCMYWTASKLKSLGLRHAQGRASSSVTLQTASDEATAVNPGAQPMYQDRAPRFIDAAGILSRSIARADKRSAAASSATSGIAALVSAATSAVNNGGLRPVSSEIDHGDAVTLMLMGELHMGVSGTTNIQVLASGDSCGVVTLNAFGFFPVGCIDLSGAFNTDPEETERWTVPSTCEVRLSSDMKVLYAVLKSVDRWSGKPNKSEEDSSTDDVYDVQYRLVTINTSQLSDYMLEVRHIAAQCGAIGETIAQIQDATHAMAKAWSDGLFPLRKLLEPIREQLRLYGRPNTVEQELFMMLTCGVSSGALQTFVSSLDENALQRLSKGLDVACATVDMLATCQLVKAAELLVFRLSELEGMSRWVQRFSAVGLNPETLRSLMRVAEVLALKATEVQLWVRDARANFAAFTLWLQRIVRKHVASSSDPSVTRPNQRTIPLYDSSRLIHLLEPNILISSTYVAGAPNSNPRKAPSVGVPNGSILHNHISQQFQNAALRSNVVPDTSMEMNQAQGSRSRSGSSEAPKPNSSTYSSRKGDKIAPISLRQALELVRERWRIAFNHPSETLSSAFAPLNNVPLCIQQCQLPSSAFGSRTENAKGNNSDSRAEQGLESVARIPADRSIAIHFQTDPVDEELTDRVRVLGHFLLIAFVATTKQSGLEQDTLMVVRRATNGDGISPVVEWSATLVSIPKDTCCHDVQFYGEAPGGVQDAKPTSRSHPKLILVVSDVLNGRRLVTVDLSNLSFTRLMNAGSLEKRNPDSFLVTDILNELRIKQSCDMTQLNECMDRERTLLPKAREASGLVVSGTRGIACVFTKNQRIQVFDIEDDEEESEDEEEEEGSDDADETAMES